MKHAWYTEHEIRTESTDVLVDGVSCLIDSIGRNLERKASRAGASFFSRRLHFPSLESLLTADSTLSYSHVAAAKTANHRPSVILQ